MKNLKLKNTPLSFLIFGINLLMWLVIGLEFLGLLLEIGNSLLKGQILFLETHKVVIKILNILIIYELFSTLMTALEHKKIELILILDTALIFLIRELLIVVFTYKTVSFETGISFSLVILSLGILRFLYAKYQIK